MGVEKYIPEVRINKENIMHIHNNTAKSIFVMVAPNKDWLMGDLAFEITKSIYSGNSSPGGIRKILGSGPKQVKNIGDLWDLFCYLKKLYGILDPGKTKKIVAVLDESQKIKQQYEEVKNAIQSNCIRIEPGETEIVNVKKIWGTVLRLVQYVGLGAGHMGSLFKLDGLKNSMEEQMKKTKEWKDYKKNKQKLQETIQDISFSDFVDEVMNVLDVLNPSVLLSSLGLVADMRVIVANENFEKTAFFRSNSNHSWIVNDTSIVRSAHEKITTPAPEEGYKFFARIKGNMLLPGEFLEPNDALMVETSASNIPEIPIRETDSLLMKYAKGKTQGHMALAKGTMGHVMDIFCEWQYILIYQEDGNLVFYKNNGKTPTVIWSTDTFGKPAGKVRMDADGNLIMVSKNGRIQWALWSTLPKYAVGGYIKLDPLQGTLGFYKKNSQKMEFEIVNKNDTFKPLLPMGRNRIVKLNK